MGMMLAPKIDEEKKTLITINPATLEDLGEVEIWSEERVASAVERAREVGRSWAGEPVENRVAVLKRAKEVLLDRADEIALLLVQETGKTLVDAMNAEIATSADLMEYFIKKGPGFLAPEKINIRFWALGGRKSTLHHPPLGVVGVISPWNYPFYLSMGPVFMALLAGNGVVLKPSEVTPLIGLKIGEIFREAGLPEGLLQVATGDGTTGKALVDAAPDCIAFTGSVATGKKIMAGCAEHLTPVVLELGGKDAMIVCRDADVDVAVEGAVWSSFGNSGQTCASVERLYVDESIREAFVSRFLERTRELRQGIGTSHDTDVGSMTSLAQLQLVDEQVADARERGATILTGGQRNPEFAGYFYEPTILTDLDHSFPVMRDETFGPVVGIMPFDSEEEALRLANDSRYGLTASVWTKDMKRGVELARHLEAGNVTINDHLITAGMAETPWGGTKESGIGRMHGKMGLLSFVEVRHVHENPLPGMKNPWWYPYSEAKYRAGKAMTHALGGRGAIDKLKGISGMLWNLLKG